MARLVAVEIDRDLAAALPRTVPAPVRVVDGDFLETDLAALLGGEPAPVRVVGNLPYNVSSPILFRLLARRRPAAGVLRDATVMLQKEVADRVAGPPGVARLRRRWRSTWRSTPTPSALLTLPPGAFRPPPKVTSAVVRLRFRPPPVDVGRPGVFERAGPRRLPAAPEDAAQRARPGGRRPLGRDAGRSHCAGGS